MLAVLLLLIGQAMSGSHAWLAVQCSDDQIEETASMQPATDGVAGRYVVQYCTKSNPPPVKWYLELHTIADTPEENCTSDVLDKDRLESVEGTQHSSSEEHINTASVNISCPYVCLSQALDLIFQSCYRLDNKVGRQGRSKHIVTNSIGLTSYLYINNKIARLHKNTSSEWEECIDYSERVVCTWFGGAIPYTSYVVMLIRCTENQEVDWTALVTDNCTRVGGALGGQVRCELHVPPGAYIVQLSHTAPWTRGLGDLVHHYAYFNVTQSLELVVAAGGGGGRLARWAAGALLLLGASLLGGLLAYQKRRKAKLKIRVWQEWLASRAEAESRVTDPRSGAEGAGGAGGAAAVLLLHARDCPPAQRAAAALAQLLAEPPGAQVVDLYSAETTALAARSPAAWLRECMTAPNVRVVLLQTPALAALHAVRLAATPEHALKLEEPLLPRRVMYRSPVFGDTLLQYALQLLQETAHAQATAPYRKYFLATLSELSVDLFPSVVPFTRFELPLGAPALLHALRAPAPAPAPAPAAPPAGAGGALAELAAACGELAAYVRDNPNYLAEQLMFL